MQKDKANKSMRPPSNKMVQIKLIKDVVGIGKADDVVEVSELVALNFVSQGFAAILETEKEN
jgi:ribosomal protein L9